MQSILNFANFNCLLWEIQRKLGHLFSYANWYTPVLLGVNYRYKPFSIFKKEGPIVIFRQLQNFIMALINSAGDTIITSLGNIYQFCR